MKKTILAIAAMASMFASSAFAQQAYVGAGIGQGHTNLDCAGASDCSKNATGFKLFGGYKFTPNLAAEVNYFDFGKASASAPGLSLDLRGTAWGIGGAFMTDIASNWTGVVRLGVASVKMKGDAVAGTLSGSDSERSTNAYAGFGIGYLISKDLSVDAAFDFTRGKFQGESGNLRLLSIGLTKSF